MFPGADTGAELGQRHQRPTRTVTHAALDRGRANPSAETPDRYSPPRLSVEALRSSSTLRGMRSVTARAHPRPGQDCRHYCHPRFLMPDLPPPALCQSALGCDQTRCKMRSPISLTLLPPPGLPLSSPIRRVLLAWRDSAPPPSISSRGCWTRSQCKVNELRSIELHWGIFFPASERRVRVNVACWKALCRKPLAHSKFEVYGCAAKYVSLVQGREQKFLSYALFLELMFGFFPLPYAF